MTPTIGSHSPLNISETVRDRDLVPRTTNRKWLMESDGRVIDDVTWFWKVKLVTPIRLEPNTRKQVEMLF